MVLAVAVTIPKIHIECFFFSLKTHNLFVICSKNHRLSFSLPSNCEELVQEVVALADGEEPNVDANV